MRVMKNLKYKADNQDGERGRLEQQVGCAMIGVTSAD